MSLNKTYINALQNTAHSNSVPYLRNLDCTTKVEFFLHIPRDGGKEQLNSTTRWMRLFSLMLCCFNPTEEKVGIAEE
jgi:hypothetical protein